MAFNDTHPDYGSTLSLASDSESSSDVHSSIMLQHGIQHITFTLPRSVLVRENASRGVIDTVSVMADIKRFLEEFVSDPGGVTDVCIELKLPTKLEKPKPRPIPPEALAAVNEDLAGVAPEYARNVLDKFRRTFYDATLKVKIINEHIISPEGVPTSELPSHLFVVHSSSETSGDDHVPMFLPAHGIIYASHCAGIKPFPRHITIGYPPHTGNVILDVLDFPVPSVKTFPLVHHYIYTRDVDQLRIFLIPSYLRALDTEMLSTSIATKHTVRSILAALSTVHQFSANITALNVVDNDNRLWETINLAWAVLTCALKIKESELLGGEPGAFEMFGHFDSADTTGI